MSSLKSKVAKIEASIDVTRLSGEQIRSLSISRLNRRQKEALDVTQLTEEQVLEIGFENMTNDQLEALGRNLDEVSRKWLQSLSDEELEAVAEGRLWMWYPGYKPE